jgi:hypothetical protein
MKRVAGLEVSSVSKEGQGASSGNRREAGMVRDLDAQCNRTARNFDDTEQVALKVALLNDRYSSGLSEVTPI